MSDRASIQRYSFDDDLFKTTGSLFPPALANDRFVLYHGTSSALAPDIEQHGISWAPRLYTAEDVLAVRSIYESMNWDGPPGFGPLTILGTFTDSDFSGGSSKPVYLATESWRAAAHSMSYWAGGETAGALRVAIANLRAFIEDPAIQTQHLERQVELCIVRVRSLRSPSRVINVDLDWLRAKLRELLSLEECLKAAAGSHQRGVVFAVRVAESAFDRMVHSDFRGVECYIPVPREWIVGRMDLTDEQCGWTKSALGTGEIPMHLEDREDARTAVLQRMNAPEGEQRGDASHVAVPVDPAAGRDLSAAIVARDGP